MDAELYNAPSFDECISLDFTDSDSSEFDVPVEAVEVPPIPIQTPSSTKKRVTIAGDAETISIPHITGPLPWAASKHMEDIYRVPEGLNEDSDLTDLGPLSARTKDRVPDHIPHPPMPVKFTYDRATGMMRGSTGELRPASLREIIAAVDNPSPAFRPRVGDLPLLEALIVTAVRLHHRVPNLPLWISMMLDKINPPKEKASTHRTPPTPIRHNMNMNFENTAAALEQLSVLGPRRPPPPDLAGRREREGPGSALWDRAEELLRENTDDEEAEECDDGYSTVDEGPDDAIVFPRVYRKADVERMMDAHQTDLHSSYLSTDRMIRCVLDRSNLASMSYSAIFADFTLGVQVGDEYKPILYARKKKKSKLLCFVISTRPHDAAKRFLVGRLKSNLLRTQFTLYSTGVNKNRIPAMTSYIQQKEIVRRELLHVTFSRPPSRVVIGPVSPVVFIPRLTKGVTVPINPVGGQTGLGTFKGPDKKLQDVLLPAAVTRHRAARRQARRHEDEHVLAMNGRAEVASTRNVVLRARSDTSGRACFILGRRSDGRFNVDFKDPLMPVQALGLAIAVAYYRKAHLVMGKAREEGDEADSTVGEADDGTRWVVA